MQDSRTSEPVDALYECRCRIEAARLLLQGAIDGKVDVPLALVGSVQLLDQSLRWAGVA